MLLLLGDDAVVNTDDVVLATRGGEFEGGGLFYCRQKNPSTISATATQYAAFLRWVAKENGEMPTENTVAGGAKETPIAERLDDLIGMWFFCAHSCSWFRAKKWTIAPYDADKVRIRMDGDNDLCWAGIPCVDLGVAVGYAEDSARTYFAP